jgi:hypothetical protein
MIEMEGIKNNLLTMPPPDLLWLAINFASYRADYDFISTEFDFDDDFFGTWFSSRYPNVLETADEIYQKLKAVDISSNDSIKAYLQWALTNYNITGATIDN